MTRVTLRYSEPLIRKAVGRFWWRTTGWSFLVAAVLVLSAFVALMLRGDRSWRVGLLGGVVVLAITFAAALYVVHYRQSIGRLRRMRTPEATLEMEDERFRMSSDLGTTELVWSAIREVWVFPDCLLVFFSRAQFATIPTQDLDDSARQFLLERARASGARFA
jgi:hypothetical protein